MIEAIIWMAVGALAVIAGLVCYATYIGLMTDDDKYRRDIKHRNHHRWQG